MKTFLFLALTMSAAAVSAADVPVKRVALFSSGVGYFEHDGKVNGETTTELRFKTEQVNDILKSLVLEDLDGGKVSTVTYPSQDPLSRILGSFQVDLSKNPPLHDLLNQLRGAKLTVVFQAEQLTGVILGVEKRQKPVGDKNVVDTFWLNLIVGAAMRSVPMEEIRSIHLEDANLQAELDKALEAVARARDQEKKTVSIHFEGKGERHVRIGYVIETPIWKTSYRLVLSDKAPNDANLQGWAIVENQTDTDWNDTELSLVSGRPISFVQDLYQPLYIPRPRVEPELFSSLRPQVYGGGMAPQESATATLAEQPPGAPARRMEKSVRSRAAMLESDNLAAAAPQVAPMDIAASVVSAASAAKIGELFQYTVGNVNLSRQRSAMLPIVTDPVEAEKLSIYNQGVLATNPLNGARLKNTTGKHLLQGPITVFEAGRYAGDARIDNVPPGQERLLSYGIDLQMTVNSTKTRQEARILTGKLVKGVLELQRKTVFTQDYAIENKSDQNKKLIIEHPFRQNWKLVETADPIETTETLYRFRTEAAAGKKSTFTVKEQIVEAESIEILPLDLGQIQIYLSNGEIPADVKAALRKAAELKRAMAETQSKLDERQHQITEISNEQTRLRENMKTVAQNSEYYGRLLKKLNAQETDIERLQNESEELRKQLDRQRKELEDYLTSLNVG